MCDYAYRDKLEDYADDDPARDIYTDEIEGMSLDAWNDLRMENATLVCVFDSGKDSHPIKLASRSRPVVYHYEIYEREGTYYLKVVYLVSHKADKVVEYVAHYKYKGLSKEALEVMKERNGLWQENFVTFNIDEP